MSDAPTSTPVQELQDLRAELAETQILLRRAGADLAESEADQRVCQARLEERTKAYALADQVRTEEREFLIGLLRPVIPDAPSFSGTLLETIKAVMPLIVAYMERRPNVPCDKGRDDLDEWFDHDWSAEEMPAHWRVHEQAPAIGSVGRLVLVRDDGLSLEFTTSHGWRAGLRDHGYAFPSVALLGDDTEPEIVIGIVDEKFPRPFTFEQADEWMDRDEANVAGETVCDNEPELWRPTFRINDNVLPPWALSLRIVVTTHPGDGPLQALCFNRPDGYRVSWNEAQAEPGWYVFSGSSSYPVDRLVPGNVHDALRVASERFPYVEPATPEPPAGWIRSGTSYRPVYGLGQSLPSGWRLVALQHTTDGFVDVISFFRDDGVTVRWQSGAAPAWYVHCVSGSYPGDIDPIPVREALALVDRVRPATYQTDEIAAHLPDDAVLLQGDKPAAASSVGDE